MKPTPNGGNGDRDSNGRFVNGNPGGPGNPFARQTASLRRGMLQAVTPADIREIVRALVEAAKSGDVAAARLLLAYGVGEPGALQESGLIQISVEGLMHVYESMALAVARHVTDVNILRRIEADWRAIQIPEH